MQPTKAARWFGAMLLASAIAAMTVILLSAFLQSRMMSVEPANRQLVASQMQSPEVERPAIAVTIEPSRIEVIGRRSSSIFETLADWLPRRGDAS
jgi:archaellin